jgi:hypothetical protein
MAKRKTPPPPAPLALVQKADTSGQDAASEPDEETDGLSPMEQRFVDMSGTGTGMEDMAGELGLSSRTLRRWKLKPEIATAIRLRTSELMSQTRATLASASSRAARELSKLAESAEPDTARVSACRAVIANAAKFAEVEEIQQRLAELEARLAQQQPNRFRS